MTIAAIVTLGFDGTDNFFIATLGFSPAPPPGGWVPAYVPVMPTKQQPVLQRLRTAAPMLISFRKPPTN